MRVTYIYISILFILITGVLSGYGQDNIILKTRVDSTLMGLDVPLNVVIKDGEKIDSFQLKVMGFDEMLKVYAPKVENGEYIQKAGLIPEDIENIDFEISDYGNWKGSGNTLIPGNSSSNQIKIKIWDFGKFYIMPMRIVDKNGKIDTIYPEDPDMYPEISVFAGLNPQDTIPQITPIKDIITEKKTWEDYKFIILGIIVLFLIILMLIFLPKIFISKKSLVQPSRKIKKSPPAHIIALEKLSKLKAEKIWREGKVKEFQSQLTYILREYLENRYKIQALEQTTGEIVHSLQKIKLDNKDIDTIKNILQIADMVKFAKAKPEEDINERFLNETIDFVERTKAVTVQNNKKG